VTAEAGIPLSISRQRQARRQVLVAFTKLERRRALRVEIVRINTLDLGENRPHHYDRRICLAVGRDEAGQDAVNRIGCVTHAAEHSHESIFGCHACGPPRARVHVTNCLSVLVPRECPPMPLRVSCGAYGRVTQQADMYQRRCTGAESTVGVRKHQHPRAHSPIVGGAIGPLRPANSCFGPPSPSEQPSRPPNGQ